MLYQTRNQHEYVHEEIVMCFGFRRIQNTCGVKKIDLQDGSVGISLERQQVVSLENMFLLQAYVPSRYLGTAV